MRLISILILLLMGVLFVNAQTEQRKLVEVKAKDISKTGPEFEIKQDRTAATDSALLARGKKPTTCWLPIHNYTAYSIDIYINGYWEGAIGPYDDSNITVNEFDKVWGMSVGKSWQWKIDFSTCTAIEDNVLQDP